MLGSRTIRPALGVVLAGLGLLGVWLTAVAAQSPAGVVDLSGFGSTGGVALALSERTFGGADEVLIARDDVFADALASGALQGDRPLLLTGSTALSDGVGGEIQRLGASGAVLLGGDAALSPTVEEDLGELGLTVRRLQGASRVETAVAAAEDAEGASTALLVRAFERDEATQAFADSLAVGGWAAASGAAVLLTATDGLSEASAAALTDGSFQEVVIVGGESAVDNEVAADVARLGLPVRRVAGATRSATAVAVAIERGYESVDDAETVIVVESRAPGAWAAGFAGAAAAAAWDAPILLVEDGELAPPTREWLTPSAQSFSQSDPDGATMPPPRLVCAATTEVCEDVAELIGAPPPPTPTPTASVTEEGVRAVFDGDGTSHRNALVTGTLTGTDPPDQIQVTGPCVAGAPITVNVDTDGGFAATVDGDAMQGPCTVEARNGNVILGDTTLDVLLGRLVAPLGTFLDPDDVLRGRVVDAGPLSTVAFEGGCLVDDGAIDDTDPTVFVGTFNGTIGFCSIGVTVTYPDGGFETFPGPSIPNSYVCGDESVTNYNRPNHRVTTISADSEGLLNPYNLEDSSFVVDGEPVGSRGEFELHLSHGDCFRADGRALYELVNVDQDCPESFFLTGVTTTSSGSQPPGTYNEDAGGVRSASEQWTFSSGDDFVVNGDPVDVNDFVDSVNRFDCVRLQIDPKTGAQTHMLVDREWSGP